MTMTISVERLALGDLARLGKVNPPAITILLGGPTLDSDRARASRIKSSVDAVFHKLLGLGMNPHEIARMVAPVLSVGEDATLREHLHSGVGLFVDSDSFYYFEIPNDTPETVAVGSHFYLRPLLDWLTEPRQFFILELLPTHVSLTKGTADRLIEIPLPRGVPFSLDAMSRDEGPEWISRPGGIRKVHTEEPTSAISPATAIRFGMASANEERRIRFFCALVDRGLHSLLVQESIPLVLAGSERLVSAFRKENTYPATVPRTLGCTMEGAKPEEIIQRTRNLIRLETVEEATRHLVAMEEYAQGDRWSTDLPGILRGAYQGRVWRLFLAHTAESTGNFHRCCGLPEAGFPYQEDLVNAAAVETLAHGGEVHMVDAEQLPANAVMAALFRYSTGAD